MISELRQKRNEGPKGLAEYRARIGGALRACGGWLHETSEALGVSYATLKAWIAEDAVLSAIPRPGRGRPKKSDGTERKS